MAELLRNRVAPCDVLLERRYTRCLAAKTEGLIVPLLLSKLKDCSKAC